MKRQGKAVFFESQEIQLILDGILKASNVKSDEGHKEAIIGLCQATITADSSQPSNLREPFTHTFCRVLGRQALQLRDDQLEKILTVIFPLKDTMGIIEQDFLTALKPQLK